MVTWDTSATSICAREEEFAGGGELLDAGKGKGRRRGLGWNFIGGQLWRMEGEQGRGQDSVSFHTGAGSLPFGAAPSTGRERKGASGKKESGGRRF